MKILTLNKLCSKLKVWCSQMPNFSYCHRCSTFRKQILSKIENIKNDCRYQNQDKYLQGLKILFIPYKSKTENDHDHCEFCWGKFSSVILGAFNEGWTDENQYRWIGNKCFQDFKVKLKLARK
ncbi:MAG: hypothetical protein CSA95_02315 [Bacteroidetes bacterium]|nr:MAG: hypothetical protein CSA95_02315 [Bacteroidota bacterium]